MAKLTNLTSIKSELFDMGQKRGIFIPPRDIVEVKFNASWLVGVRVKRRKHFKTKQEILGSQFISISPKFFELTGEMQRTMLKSAVDVVIAEKNADLELKLLDNH